MWILVKITNHQYLGQEAKNEKNRRTLLSATSKFWENKVVLLFSNIFGVQQSFWALIGETNFVGRDLDQEIRLIKIYYETETEK